MTHRNVKPGALRPLTKRELEVLHLMADGFNAEHGSIQLCISDRTWKVHRQHILEKLKASNSAQAIAIAFRQDIIN